MKLADLNPAIKDGFLMLNCPNPQHQHSIRIPIREDRAFRSHSLDCGACFHLTLTDGELK